MKVGIGRMRDWVGQRLHRLAQWIGGRSYGGPTATARLSVTTPDIRPKECEIDPSKPYAGDWLGREEFGNGLSRLTQYGSGSGVVLVDGGWGSGKTTFVRMWAASMRNEGRTVVEVNAWAGDYADSPFDDVVKQLGRGLREQHRGLRHLPAAAVGMTAGLLSWAWGVRALKGSVEYIDPNVVVPVAKLIWTLQRVAWTMRNRTNRLGWLKTRLTLAARYYGGRRRQSLIVVIDELDRCRPDYALRFLETIKHVFEVPYVTFVVAANARELSQAVKGVYGDGFDGSGYVERFFDIWLPLTDGDRENYVRCCLADQSFKEVAGKDVLFNAGSDTRSAEEVAVRLLTVSSLNLRQIKKAVRHIAITLLFNRSEEEEFAATVVFVGLTRHISLEAYEAIWNGMDDDAVVKRLLGVAEPSHDNGAIWNLAMAFVAMVRRDESTCAAARRALEAVQLMDNQTTGRENR